PVEGSTAEDFVDLEPVDPTPQTRGNRWKTDAAAMSETIELTPIDLSAPSPMNALPPDLSPIDDLFGPDPLAASASRASAGRSLAGGMPSAAAAVAPAQATPILQRSAKNVWDSPLMLIGGGALGVIFVVFALLFYALTRGSAAELFAKAEEEYRGGSYSNAIGIYEQFIKQYPDDPSAGLARVRRGMATLRQVTDDGKNPRLGLETAHQVLPEIEKEEQFGEARSELATILPDSTSCASSISCAQPNAASSRTRTSPPRWKKLGLPRRKETPPPLTNCRPTCFALTRGWPPTFSLWRRFGASVKKNSSSSALPAAVPSPSLLTRRPRARR
ncbi:MAG: hypothetical protein JF612_15310, partial [Planctomycetia bacterium]|nr:hypothetical protein [Planctomycetia bacterium]